MASARHQSDAVVKHWASPLGSGNWFFCKSQRLGCERRGWEERRGEERRGAGRKRGEMGLGKCEKMEAKLMFPSGVERPPLLVLLKAWLTSGSLRGSSAACPNHHLWKAGLSAQLEMWTETFNTRDRRRRMGLCHGRRFYIPAGRAQVWLIALIKGCTPLRCSFFSGPCHCACWMTYWNTQLHMGFYCSDKPEWTPQQKFSWPPRQQPKTNIYLVLVDWQTIKVETDNSPPPPQHFQAALLLSERRLDIAFHFPQSSAYQKCRSKSKLIHSLSL